MKLLIKKIVFCLAVQLFFSQAHALETDFEEYEIKVQVDAVKSEDLTGFGASSNEYQLELRLQELIPDSKYSRTRAIINGGTGDIYRPFASYQKIKVGESFSASSSILLPKSLLSISQIQISIFDADFTIPVPGPCCLLINKNDLVYKKSFSLEDANSITKGENTNVTVSIRKVREEVMSLNNYVDVLSDSIEVKRGLIFAPVFPVSDFYEFLLRNIE